MSALGTSDFKTEIRQFRIFSHILHVAFLFTKHLYEINVVEKIFTSLLQVIEI